MNVNEFPSDFYFDYFLGGISWRACDFHLAAMFAASNNNTVKDAAMAVSQRRTDTGVHIVDLVGDPGKGARGRRGVYGTAKGLRFGAKSPVKSQVDLLPEIAQYIACMATKGLRRKARRALYAAGLRHLAAHS